VDVDGDIAMRAGTRAGVAAPTKSDREVERRNFEEATRTECMNPDRKSGGRSVG